MPTRLLRSFLFLLPLVSVPGLPHPFSTPKAIFGAAGTGVVLLVTVVSGQLHWRFSRPMTLALAAFVVAATIAAWRAGAAATPAFGLLLSGPVLLALVAGLGPDEAGSLVPPLVASACIVGLVTVAQAAGYDIWQMVGWTADVAYTSPRMRAYGTLGNPNFVGAFLAAVLPFAGALAVQSSRHRQWALAAIAPGAAALLATRSRVSLVAAALGLVSLWIGVAAARRRTSPQMIVVGTLIITLAIVVAGAVGERSVRKSLLGRLVPVRIVLPRAREHLLLGFGLQSVEREFPAWQEEFFQNPRHAALAPFAGAFEHLHNDPVEWLIEAGALGLGALVAIVALVVRGFFARTRASTGKQVWQIAGICSVLALGAASFADFPLHRPVGYLLFWVALGLAASPPCVSPRGRTSSRVGNASR